MSNSADESQPRNSSVAQKTQLPCYAGLKGRNVHIMWPPSQLNHVFICFLSCVCDVCEIVFHFHESPPLHDVKHVWSWNLGKTKKNNMFDFGLWISSGKFSEKNHQYFGSIDVPFFQPCLVLPVLRTTPFDSRVFRSAVNGASSKSRPWKTVFHAQSLQGKNVRLVCLQNCIQTCREIDFLIH